MKLTGVGASRYNSVVFSEYASNDYVAYIISPNILYQTAGSYGVQWLLDSVPGRKMLDPAACLEAYNVGFVDSYRDVIVVLDNVNASRHVFWGIQVNGESEGDGISWIEGDGISWICSSKENCITTMDPSAAEDWRARADDPILNLTASNSPESLARVSYCLAEETEAQCTVVVATTLLAVVILCNSVKTICLSCIILRGRRGFAPLITVGDAVASFLAIEDVTTLGEGGLFSKEVEEWAKKRSDATYGLFTSHRPNRAWSSKRHFWFRGASPRNWVICIFL